MKKINLLLLVLTLVSFNSFALDKVLCDFDNVNPTEVGNNRGAVFELIDNPFMDDSNGTAKCGQYYSEDADIGTGNVTRQWTSHVAIPIEEVTIPASGNFYVHILVNCYTRPDIAVTFENVLAKPENRPVAPYNVENVDQWQDMVFKIPAAYAGMTVDTINFYGDMKWESGNAFVTDMFTHVYFDEIEINENPLSRFSDVVIPETLEETVSTMEDGQLNWAAQFGAIISVEDNPAIDGLNTTTKCLKLADAKETLWALVDKDVDIILPKKECYFHVMAKSVASPNIILRMMPDNKTDIHPLDSLVPNDQWQDLVFDVSAAKAGGTEVSQVRFLLDYYGANLNASDSVLFLDEMVFSTDSMPRTGATAIEKLQNGSISIYPSVLQNELNIVGGNVLMLDIFSLSGRCILSAPVIDNTVDVSLLNSGIYIIQGKDMFGNVLFNQKVVKQ